MGLFLIIAAVWILCGLISIFIEGLGDKLFNNGPSGSELGILSIILGPFCLVALSLVFITAYIERYKPSKSKKSILSKIYEVGYNAKK